MRAPTFSEWMLSRRIWMKKGITPSLPSRRFCNNGRGVSSRDSGKWR